MTVKGGSHSEDTKRQISATKRAQSGRSTEALIPQLCACGCGEYAKVDERRNRVAKYLAGHNAKSSHPMQGRHHSDETRQVLSEKSRAQMEQQFPDRTPKHLRNSGAHHSWQWMMSRCFDSWNASYPLYGGRGITVCERWLKFENFLADMGARPDGMTLDRISGDGNYEPGNCRWATRKEQDANRRNPWDTRRARYGPSGRKPRETGAT